MPITPPVHGQQNWDVPLNAALNTLESEIVSTAANANTYTDTQLVSEVTRANNTYLQKLNNLSDINSAAASRVNLGLGNSSTRNVGTTAGTVAAGDDPRLTAALLLADPSVFNVKTYAAQGDGVTDDTVAIRNTVTAAVNWATTNNHFDCTVYFPPGTYLIASTPIKGGTTFGNAQIPIPIIATTVNKVTLRFKGLGDTALPHWQQTVPQNNGVVLKTTYQELTIDGVHGEVSVIGGPTPQQGYGLGTTTLFNNVCVVVDGIQILAKSDHTAGYISGFDFRGCAEAHVAAASVFIDHGPPGIIFPNGAGFEFGLAMPFPANNAYCKVDTFSVEGFTYGAWLSEHCIVTTIQVVYCYDGLVMIGSYEGSGAVQHNLKILYAAVEACTNAVLVTPSARFEIDQLDVENITSLHLHDPDQTSVGYIGLTGIISSINVDTTKVRVIYLDRAPGAFTAPSMPLSGVSFRSPAWRNSAVVITGGTVTSISIDGVVTGLTSGTVILPSGRNISIVYSVAPTWTWTLL